MIPLAIQDVAAAIGARCVGSGPAKVQRVSHDSRDIHPGDLFFAIRGNRLDGHEFVEDSAARGAVACVCDDRWSGCEEPPAGVTYLVVSDTTAALGKLAAWYRTNVMSVSTVVVAVTGSNGKTTTKHMIDHVLGGFLRGRASPKSFNNHIGVPLTLLTVEAEDRYAVIELGMNSPGEIAFLADIARPDVAVITSIGEAHLEGLGTVQAIAAEKASMLRYVQPRGSAIINIDRVELQHAIPEGLSIPLLTFGTSGQARLRITEQRGALTRTTFTIEGRYPVELNLPGVHHATNACAAFAVARWFGIAPGAIIERLRSFTAVEGRTKVLSAGGVTIVDDSYNANPSSMGAAISSLSALHDGRRVMVMGDMFELGLHSAVYHQRVVRQAAQSGIDVMVVVGPLMVEAARSLGDGATRPCIVPCDHADAAVGALLALVREGDVVWIKGSRGMKLDRVVEQLREQSRSSVAAA